MYLPMSICNSRPCYLQLQDNSRMDQWQRPELELLYFGQESKLWHNTREIHKNAIKALHNTIFQVNKTLTNCSVLSFFKFHR